MLGLRILTGLLLGCIALGLLFFGEPPLLNFLGILLFLSLGYEWTKLVPITCPSRLVGCGILLLFSLSTTYRYFNLYFTVNMLAWIGISYALITFPKSKTYVTAAVVSLAALLMLPLAAISTCLIYQYPAGQTLLLYLLLIVWISDTGAYFAGKLFGKHKLIPNVSPGKTIEGTLGGIFFTLCLITAAYFYFKPEAPLYFFLQGIVTLFMTIVGDLWISLLKRRVGCKDTGNWLPGHGGVLDRLDSYIAAAPFFFVFLR